MKKGTIVLVSFPFTDLSSEKRRPAVIISKEDHEKSYLIVAFISSVIPLTLSKADLVIDSSDKSFKQTGLIKTSVIKADKLLTIEKSLVTGEIGSLSSDVMNKLNEKLKTELDLK